MELVEQDARLRRMGRGGGAKRLPHVHHREANPRGFLGAEPGEERIHAGLGAVRAAEPDRPPAQQVADDDPIGVPFPDRHLVDADDLRPGRAGAPQLLAHVLLLERLDRVPLQLQLLGDVLDGRGPAPPPDVEREALGVAGIVGQEVEPLALHRATGAARDPAQLELHHDPQASAREVAHPVHPAIVEAAVDSAAHATGRFFERRTSVTRRTPGSPKMPTTVGRGRKPGNRYESERRRRGLGNRIPQSCHVCASAQPRSQPLPERVSALPTPLFYPLKPPKSRCSFPAHRRTNETPCSVRYRCGRRRSGSRNSPPCRHCRCAAGCSSTR